MLILGAAVTPVAAAAQTPDSTSADTLRSSITATVRDSLGVVVPGASVLITPGGHIYRTDSAGGFIARHIPPGALTIRVRKPGFSPLQSRVNLHVGADLSLDLVMQRLPQVLAEVEIRANRQCQRYALEGILCRQEQYGGSYFMNRVEILEKARDISYARLLLRESPGFRQSLTGDPRSVESIVGWRCIRWIYDGGFPYSYNPVVRPSEVYAIEVYQPPDIPLEYQHQYWGQIRVGRRMQHAPCTLVVMWSMTEAQRQLKRLAPPG
ncbi:MAG TPA: carboxypeptidase-like regulatory domain-containing protein [Gemmatimonadaceae bacterium]